MLLCERVVLTLFGFEIGVDRGLIGVIVGQRGMYLRQRQVAEVVYDPLPCCATQQCGTRKRPSLLYRAVRRELPSLGR